MYLLENKHLWQWGLQCVKEFISSLKNISSRVSLDGRRVSAKWIQLGNKQKVWWFEGEWSLVIGTV